MSRLKIASSNSLSIKSTVQTASMKAAVYLQTSDMPNDPLAVERGTWGIPKTIKNVADCARIYWAISIKIYRNVALQDLPQHCSLSLEKIPKIDCKSLI